MFSHKFWTDVSEDTRAKLTVYEGLLRKWQPSLNLVSHQTLDDSELRHFLDSAQLYTHIKDFSRLACLGSGAGFPGAVMAIMGHQDVTLIERDQKKAVFLRTVSRETGVPFRVVCEDIREHNEQYDCIVSRALAAVTDLLDLSEAIRKPTSECFYLKGTIVDQELSQAQELWGMTASKIQSITDNNGVILHLTNITRKA